MTSAIRPPSPAALGLKRGSYAAIARRCHVSVTHVRAVALGHRIGKPSIVRQLTARGWSKP